MDEDYYEKMTIAGQSAQARGMMNQADNMEKASQYVYEEKEKTLAEAQLEVETILSEIYHLLKQDIYREIKEGSGVFAWKPLANQQERTLTDWGVDRLMQLCKFYINKNTLLSNFDDTQIKRRMLRFIQAINGLMLMKYEYLFMQPSFEECKNILRTRLEEKKKMRVYNLETLGEKIDEKKIEEQILKEIYGGVEKEIEKIRKERMKQNLRELEILMVQLESIVEATHNRAWRGEERGSIRRHTSIHELIGGRPTQNDKGRGGGFNWRGN